MGGTTHECKDGLKCLSVKMRKLLRKNQKGSLGHFTYGTMQADQNTTIKDKMSILIFRLFTPLYV